MRQIPCFEPAFVHPGTFAVTSIRGEEAVSRPYRFDIDLVSADPDLPLDEILGRAAVLRLGEREVHGVVAEIDQGDPAPGGYAYRAVLVPRVYLASLGARSRLFQRLGVPDMAIAVLNEVGVRVELRLGRDYPAGSHAVQYKESGLDFVSRLLAAEGIAYHFEQGEGGERLVLTDDNDGFRCRAEACLCAAGEALGAGVPLLSLGSRRAVMPRAVLLHDDAADPDAPVEAQATIDDGGVGLVIEHRGGLGTRDRAAAMAERAAEALRARSARFCGVAGRPVFAGTRLAVTGHYRRDMNREYLVTSVRHAYDGAEYRASFEAISADVPYRPALLPKPHIDGFLEARMDAAPAADQAHGDDGRCRVRLPFDLSGPAEGQGSPPMDTVSPGGAIRFPMKAGTPVMVGFMEGDPDRPVIAGALPQGRAAGQGRGPVAPGVIFEAGGGKAPPPGKAARSEGDLPVERPLTETETVTTDTAYGSSAAGGTEWVRFAVPQGSGVWSYIRYGDVPTTDVSASETANGQTTTHTFQESVLDGEFYSKYFNDTGDSLRSGQKGYAFKLAQLSDSSSTFWGTASSYTMAPDSASSEGSKAYFTKANSAGVFDYTDGNRSVITQGDYQSVTCGHRTDVILGDYRVVIPKRTMGMFDADDYYMHFYSSEGSWRKTEVSHVKSASVSYGDTESLYVGFQGQGVLGTTTAVTFGTTASAFLGFNLSLGAGFTFNYDMGHKLEISKGKNFTKSDTQTIEAETSIKLRIPGTARRFTSAAMPIVAATTLTTSIGSLGFGVGSEFIGPSWENRTIFLSAAFLTFIAGMAIVHKLEETEPTEKEPSIYIDKASIKLSIGTSSITLTEDKIVLETGAEDSVIELTKDSIELYGGQGAGGMGVMDRGKSVLMAPEKDVTLGAKELVIRADSVEMTGAYTVNSGALQVAQ